MKIITDNGITLFDQNMAPVHVSKIHPRYNEIYELALADDLDAALELVDMKAAIEAVLCDTELEIRNDTIYYQDNCLEGHLGNKLMMFLEKDIDITPLYEFTKNLYMNPSYRAVTELFGFLESSGLPITSDGYFMAYKKVTHDYKDIFTRTFDNKIGDKVSMPRFKVNEDKDQTCSAGLHFAAHSYADSFGSGPLMAIKINPADVVAIPTDYNNQKGRCCAYEVVAEVHGATLEEEPVYDYVHDEEDEDDYGYEDEEDDDYSASDDGCDSRCNDV